MTHVLGYKGGQNDPTYCKWLCDVVSKPVNKLILLPREHLKSTVGIAVKVTQDILQSPDISILIASKTSGMSIDRLRVIKQHLSKSSLPVVFPEIISEQPEKDASARSGTYSSLL